MRTVLLTADFSWQDVGFIREHETKEFFRIVVVCAINHGIHVPFVTIVPVNWPSGALMHY